MNGVVFELEFEQEISILYACEMDFLQPIWRERNNAIANGASLSADRHLCNYTT
jgi:hypothetical protein